MGTVEGQMDFRAGRWGMTSDEIKRAEKAEFVGRGDDRKGVGRICYRGELGSFDVDIYYIFIDDKLCSGGYYIDVEHSNPNDYICDYERIKTAMSEKYGPPTEDVTFWDTDNEAMKDDPGRALASGYLSYWATWQTGRSKVKMFMYGENDETSLSIDYVNPSSPIEDLLGSDQDLKDGL